MTGIADVWNTLSDEEMSEMIERIPEDQRGPWLTYQEQRRAGLAYRAELVERGEWDEVLTMMDSQERAAVLVAAADRIDDAQARELLAGWWSSTEAWGGDADLREGMYALLRKAGPIFVDREQEDGAERQIFGDDAVREFEALGDEDGMLTIYRGNAGEDPREGHAWTLSTETAQFFARMPWTMRGRIVFGIEPPEGAVPTVWQANVAADQVLAYFDDRGEKEVVVDPDTLYYVTKIQEAK